MSRQDQESKDSVSGHVNYNEHEVTGGGVTVTRESESLRSSLGVDYNAYRGTTFFGGASKSVSPDASVNGSAQVNTNGYVNTSVGFEVEF